MNLPPLPLPPLPLQTINDGGEGGNDLSIFSLVLPLSNRNNNQNNQNTPPVPGGGGGGGGGGINPLNINLNQRSRWAFSISTRSLWTKYCLLCTVSGAIATILSGIFLVIASIFRYFTTSTYYFETVPTYIPAILLSICGTTTIAFSCKRNRNIILLRITACWSLMSAALSSVITITTSLIHMNRLQTIKECVYNPNPPACTCFAHSFSLDNPAIHYVFENTPDCDCIHGILYSSLRAVFAISVIAVLLSIFLCMLLYQLIGHERKKAYWSRIRRINSDWSSDFVACLSGRGGGMVRERSSMFPFLLSSSPSLQNNHLNLAWGPPPPYSEIIQQQILFPPPPFPTINSNPNLNNQIISSINNNNNSTINSNNLHLPLSRPPPPPSTLTIPNNSNNLNILNPHPFSPTITSLNNNYNHLPSFSQIQIQEIPINNGNNDEELENVLIDRLENINERNQNENLHQNQSQYNLSSTISSSSSSFFSSGNNTPAPPEGSNLIFNNRKIGNVSKINSLPSSPLLKMRQFKNYFFHKKSNINNNNINAGITGENRENNNIKIPSSSTTTTTTNNNNNNNNNIVTRIIKTSKSLPSSPAKIKF